MIVDSEQRLAVPHLGGGRHLRHQVADILRASMIAGRMRGGEVYSAPSLARQFGISATPVREALLDLAVEGLVEPVRNKGFRVLELSGRQLDDITAVRRLIEVPTVASLALMTDETVRDAVQELYPVAHELVELAQRRDLVGFVNRDTSFHLSLLSPAGNPTLSEIVANLRARSRLTGLANLDRAQLVASAEEHLRILDLILAGDEAAVGELMSRHISHVRGAGAGRPDHERQNGDSGDT